MQIKEKMNNIESNTHQKHSKCYFSVKKLRYINIFMYICSRINKGNSYAH
jgi:hypothetical protein